jgi:hypothetical protein
MAKSLVPVLVFAYLTSAALAQPDSTRRKRPLPPVQQRTEEVRQTGLGEPQSKSTPESGQDTGWQSFDFNPAGDYAGEHHEPESYTPQPLCDPPMVVPTSGLGPTMLEF